MKNKKILSLIKVRTNKRFHDDSKALPGLIEDIVKSDSIIVISKIFDDGYYEGNDIFRYRTNNGILTCIKVRKNARVGWMEKGNILRNLFSIIFQKK